VLVRTRSCPADALSPAAISPRSACIHPADLTIAATRRPPVSSQCGNVSRQILLRRTPGAHRATRNSCRRVVNRATVSPLPTRSHTTRQSGNASRPRAVTRRVCVSEPELPDEMHRAPISRERYVCLVYA